MDEQHYLKLAHKSMDEILDLFDDVDVDDADAESSGDVIKITFGNGQVCVANTQRPTRQIWLAAIDRAWHFSWDDGSSSWLDDKGEGVELFAKIREVTKTACGVELP